MRGAAVSSLPWLCGVVCLPRLYCHLDLMHYSVLACLIGFHDPRAPARRREILQREEDEAGFLTLCKIEMRQRALADAPFPLFKKVPNLPTSARKAETSVSGGKGLGGLARLWAWLGQSGLAGVCSSCHTLSHCFLKTMNENKSRATRLCFCVVLAHQKCSQVSRTRLPGAQPEIWSCLQWLAILQLLNQCGNPLKS